MKKNKIEVGQCYEYNDHIYMVNSDSNTKDVWVMEDTLTKEHFLARTQDLLIWHRPFTNCG